MTTLTPRDSKDVEEAVRWALGHGKTLDIIGAGTKRGIGRPTQTDATLDLSGLSGITLYEPEELVLSAQAGTPLSEIEAAVAARGQELAFEPPDYGALLGHTRGGTIGGLLAANLSGPRRLKSGAARDHFLGFTAVSGRGETFKSGGRVVKNVTGYDLCKLMAGSWGTLAVMTGVTIKVLPRAETEATIILHGLDGGVAARAMAAAMGSSCDVSGAAHLPAGLADRISGIAARDAVTALRLEGVMPSVVHRRQMLMDILKPFGAASVVDADASRTLWRAIRDVTPFAMQAAMDERALWRISAAPMQGPQVGRVLADEAGAETLYDWAGGLVWALLPSSADAGQEIVRRAVAANGGHATLVRAPAALRAAVDVFEPQAAGVATLSARIKAGFDPNRILNPGRMYTGI